MKFCLKNNIYRSINQIVKLGKKMKKLLIFLVGILLLLLLSSGNIIEFFTWLFSLQYITPETSISGSIVVKILTFVVSYTLVGLMSLVCLTEK